MLEKLLIVLPLVAIVVAVWNIWQTAALRRRLTAVVGDAQTDSIERSLKTYFGQVKTVETTIEKLINNQRKLGNMAGLASQKISVVRFNPFGDTGGDQSFALAVLDSHNSGYVLTSIHGREGTRVYVKPIDFGKSKYTLSSEEQQAIDQATKRVPKED